jgi:endonuclease III
VISLKERKKQAARIARYAVRKYGEQKGRKLRSPINQLVLSLFCHLTSVRQATRAYRQLARDFADWNEVRVSHPAEVAACISTAHWATEAAEQLVWLLSEVLEVYNTTDFEFLRELTPTQARSCLLRIPVVRRDAADEVLLMSLDVPVLPLGEAAARMCHRLGLLPDAKTTMKNQRALVKLFGEDCLVPLHMFFCDYAERYCLPDQPVCNKCPMNRNCPYRKK